MNDFETTVPSHGYFPCSGLIKRCNCCVTEVNYPENHLLLRLRSSVQSPEAMNTILLLTVKQGCVQQLPGEYCRLQEWWF